MPRIGLTYNVTGRIGPEVRKILSAVVRATAFNIEAAAKASMTEAKHGVEYRRGGKTHVASAPGEAPAVDIGALMASVQAREDTDDLHWEVRVGAEYGVHLEFGTVHIAPRPFMAPAAEGQRDAFERACAAAVARGVRNAGKP